MWHKDRKANLAQTGCKYHYFIQFTHSFQKIVDTRALDHINIVIVILNFHWDNIICMLY